MNNTQIFLVCFVAGIVANLCTWFLVKDAFRFYNKGRQNEQKASKSGMVEGIKEVSI